jgi:diphosphomevalonate decarboxylase
MEVMNSAWRSPSNIAIVKYWGKKGFQLPANPSISFTLDNVYTETQVVLSERQTKENIEVDFFFEGNPKPEFLPKLLKFLNAIQNEFQWLKLYRLTIHSKNNFPHGTGIASSASSMSALALCVLDLHYQLIKVDLSNSEFLKKASFLSRIGSGSACRSVYGGFVEWGYHKEITGSSDEHAIAFHDIHPVFSTINDSVLIIDDGEKSVSSSKGHDLLNNHPYATQRFEQGFQNTAKLSNALKTGDIEAFGKIAEEEALTLHAMMLTSDPGYFLIKPNSIPVLEKIRQFRQETLIPVYFTMDAGPNIHLLYFDKNKTVIQDFMQAELLQYCSKTGIINNQIGDGATKLTF